MRWRTECRTGSSKLVGLRRRRYTGRVTPTVLLFVFVLLSEALLLAALVVSIVRPERRFWPPPDARRSWRWWAVWIATVVAIGGAIVLGILDWNTFVFDHRARYLVGGAAIALGLGLADWGVRTLGSRTSSGRGGEFRVAGPYRWTRNPQYMGDMLAMIGFAIVANSLEVWIAGLVGCVCLVLTPFAEEAWLAERYGEPYEAYRRRVPRFFGRRQGEEPGR